MKKHVPKITSTFPLLFKVYDSRSKQMHDVVQIHDGFPFIISSYVGGNKVTSLLNDSAGGSLHVVQALGLQDADGTEVYEGDIIFSTQGPLTDVPVYVSYGMGEIIVSRVESGIALCSLAQYAEECCFCFKVVDHILLYDCLEEESQLNEE